MTFLHRLLAIALLWKGQEGGRPYMRKSLQNKIDILIVSCCHLWHEDNFPSMGESCPSYRRNPGLTSELVKMLSLHTMTFYQISPFWRASYLPEADNSQQSLLPYPWFRCSVCCSFTQKSTISFPQLDFCLWQLPFLQPFRIRHSHLYLSGLSF